MGWYGNFKPYVPVAQRRAQAARYAKQLASKQGRVLAPVRPEGRAIATSFWGKAWCDHLQCYSDFANRLPRGRTYIRNGSVIDLVIEKGRVKALVSGSDVYTVTIDIKTLSKAAWKQICQDCSQSVASLLDLLQGRFDEGIMRRLTARDRGLFPTPAEIKMDCSCPDWADMCKHVAAVLYGVGTRLDAAPELLFTLRNVDHLELVSQATSDAALDQALAATGGESLAPAELADVFGIDLDLASPAKSKAGGRPKRTPRAGQAKAADVPTAKPRKTTRRDPAEAKSVPGRPKVKKQRTSVAPV